MVLDSVPVWKKVVAGTVVEQLSGTQQGLGNKMYLNWGDRPTLGHLGDAYGLWWASGNEQGLAEAFFIIEQWKGFDSPSQGLIRVC